MEIGATEKEWKDQGAAKAVAESVLSASPANPVPLIGFGGTHYAAREDRDCPFFRGRSGISPIPGEIAMLDEEMIREMMEKSGAVAAYIDRKALDREDLNNLGSMLKRLLILRLSESEIMAMGHLSWDTYRHVREMADQVLSRMPAAISMTCRVRERCARSG